MIITLEKKIETSINPLFSSRKALSNEPSLDSTCHLRFSGPLFSPPLGNVKDIFEVQ